MKAVLMCIIIKFPYRIHYYGFFINYAVAIYTHCIFVGINCSVVTSL